MHRLFFSLALTVALTPVTTNAQDSGINFEHLSWNAVKAKAKTQNKYIFVDCYASWCGPCKQMERSVFNDPAVATVYNKNFVSVKYQMDSTDPDTYEIKKNYFIDAYPTFLFFSPGGKIIHKAIGFQSTPEFIDMAKTATNPSTQYYSLLAKLEANKLTPKQTLTLAMQAQSLNDKQTASRAGKKYIDYLLTLTKDSLFTPDRISFLAAFTKKTFDPGFNIFIQNAARIDTVMENSHYSNEVTDDIIRESNIGSRSDWKVLSPALTREFGATTTDRVVTKSKIYYYYNKDWPQFATALFHYTVTYEDKTNTEILKKNAELILKYSTNPDERQTAAAWIK